MVSWLDCIRRERNGKKKSTGIHEMYIFLGSTLYHVRMAINCISRMALLLLLCLFFSNSFVVRGKSFMNSFLGILAYVQITFTGKPFVLYDPEFFSIIKSVMLKMERK